MNILLKIKLLLRFGPKRVRNYIFELKPQAELLYAVD